MAIPRAEFEHLPFGEMGDMIACHQIFNGAKEQRPDSVDEILDLL